MPDIDLDHLIDSVARRMTAGDPPAFRAAVMPRLRPRRSTHAWRAWTPYVAAAAAAAVVIAAVLSRSSRVAEPTVSIPAPTQSIANAAAPRREVAGHAPVVLVKGSVHVTAKGNPTSEDFGIPVLAALAPLDANTSPIQPEPLAIPQLTVQPMKELAPLVIPALGEIDRQP